MKKVLFRADKNIYKANMHCHTTVSDGKHTPEQIKEMYKARGYSIVAFTDHRNLVDRSFLNDNDFLAISGVEVNTNVMNESWVNTKTYHLNLYATKPDLPQPPQMNDVDYHDINAVNKYIKDRVDEGFLVCYNHPYWSLQTYEEYKDLRNCFAMEIYNHGCELEGYYGYNPQVFDEMLRTGNNIYCLSVDDNHNDWIDDSFGGFININSGSLEYGAIITALKNGDFYASQGPEIYEITRDGNKIHVKCSEVSVIHLYTDGRKCYFKKGENITEAEFEISGNERYVRVMCRDENKLDANSNAFWIN